MKILCAFLGLALSFFQQAHAQQVKVNNIPNPGIQVLSYTGFAQDKDGFVWISAYVNTANPAALFRYDGTHFQAYRHNSADPNSIQNQIPSCIVADRNNKIWIGYLGGGIDRFDPLTAKTIHYRTFRHDTVNTLLQDHLGHIWAGTNHGLALIDAQTGKVVRYVHQDGDAKSLSADRVTVLYEDRRGDLWVGCGAPFKLGNADPAGAGGLNLFQRGNGNFKRYLYDPKKPSSLRNNKISAIDEDSKGNFWVGTAGNGLQKLDRKTGIFTYLPYDPGHPERLSSLPTGKEFIGDNITFIQEDAGGGLWLGSSSAGLTYYNPVTKTTKHFGSRFQDRKIIYADTTGGMDDYGFYRPFTSADGLIWLSTVNPGKLYNVNANRQQVPFMPLHANGNAFYQEPGAKALWIGTEKGLIRKDWDNHSEKTWSKSDSHNSGWAHDTIGGMTRDSSGIFWIATLGGGLCRFDPVAGKASYYLHDPKNPNSISNNLARNLIIDHNHHIWVGTWGAGLDMLDTRSGHFKHYTNTKDSLSLGNNSVDCIYEAQDQTIWVGTFFSLDRLNKDGKTFHHYLEHTATFNIFTDRQGVMWACTATGLFYLDKVHDRFIPFIDPLTKEGLGEVMAIQEDANQDLWLRSSNAIVKINKNRGADQVYGAVWGVGNNSNWISRSLKGANGELFFGTLGGYYDFFPDQLKNSRPPDIAITGFKFLNTAGNAQNIELSELQMSTLNLDHRQSSFSFDFVGLHYSSVGPEKYEVMLQNYDHGWRELNDQPHADFFYVPAGHYILRIKAWNADGVSAEKDLAIIISPPWWETWWAYTLLIFGISAMIWSFIAYRSRRLVRANKLLEQKVSLRTEELEQSLKDLKNAQNQLIQSAKMASLGELTAGIAHEIQNPLNFVNNFSDVNREMLEELQAENVRPKSEQDEQLQLELLNDIRDNMEKIAHHGRRADAIVKGMLEHSKSSSGVKERTDINKLTDEYLHLAFHGMRAKDKSFNAEIVTEFDRGLPSVNIVPKDIGRVFLNLFNNAFYAVNQKQKKVGTEYVPVVTVVTQVTADGILISVQDNGDGIADAIKEKIMQPFFTTKPTGEGTGLGLSLSYDIVSKGHNGSVTFESEEGKFTNFHVLLPLP